MGQFQSEKALTWEEIASDEDHFRVLVHFSGSGLEIELKHCRTAGIVAEGLADVLGRNRGPNTEQQA
jgi:hypothetical protein